jgi:hypothetical protein
MTYVCERNCFGQGKTDYHRISAKKHDLIDWRIAESSLSPQFSHNQHFISSLQDIDFRRGIPRDLHRKLGSGMLTEDAAKVKECGLAVIPGLSSNQAACS